MKKLFLKLRVNDEEYTKFQETCDSKGKTMSEVLRAFISAYSDADNIVLLSLDKETLNNSTNLCKEKKMKFNDLVKFLLEKAIKNKDKIILK